MLDGDFIVNSAQYGKESKSSDTKQDPSDNLEQILNALCDGQKELLLLISTVPKTLDKLSQKFMNVEKLITSWSSDISYTGNSTQKAIDTVVDTLPTAKLSEISNQSEPFVDYVSVESSSA